MISTQWQSNFSNNMFQFAVLYGVSKKTGLSYTTDGWSGEAADHAPAGNGKELYMLPPEPEFFTFRQENIFHDIVPAQAFNPNIFNIKDHTKLWGYFQTDKYFIDYRQDIIKMFRFKDVSIYKKATRIIGGLNRPIVICAHSREGDYLTTDFPVMDSYYFYRALETILQKGDIKTSDVGVIIISDNHNTNKLDFLADMNISFIISEEDKFVDQTIMKLADHCITSASSFSWWGAWLNENNPIIISPKYWFNYYKSNVWEPVDIAMSIPNQFFIERK